MTLTAIHRSAIAAAALAAAAMTGAPAQAATRVGVLTCSVSAGVG